MKISFKNIPMFQTGGVALPQGTIKTGILKFDPIGNNIWYVDENLNGYHTWHSNNIVNPWLKSYQNPETVDWETYIKEGLDSWNEAGGFDWLNATPEQRKHRMTHENVRKHQQLIHDKYSGIDEQNKSHIDQYNYPENPVTTDAWRGEEWAPDSDFGIHTGNRRPSIHVNSDTKSTEEWDNYFKKLGYVGAYQYLDHWIPTKDKAKATRTFGEINTPNDEKKSSNNVPEGHRKYGFDWNKLGESLNSVLNNPNFLATGRLLGTLVNNERVYDEALKAINPDLLQTYRTHRQVVGDEATKQAYYRRAAAGETRAARPFTSDADRQIAYRNEAKAAGDELRAKGDLADNQEIRRTSDESNQHEWANIQRATEVANTNRASINKANAMKHNLLAQKHTAQWTSLDTYLQGLEYRKRQQIEEDNALADKAFLLRRSAAKYTDPEYTAAYNKYKNILDAHKDSDNNYDYTNEEVQKAIRDWKIFNAEYDAKEYDLLREHRRNRNRSLIYSAKEGSKIKITRKKKDDLLYKSVRDSVEHFRKMSKMSSDALDRKEIKIKKLAPHPKGNTKKYQQGGVAPFYIYKPVALGGETTTSTQNDTSDTISSKSEKSEGQDLLKELFKNLNTEGLPSDVNKVFSQIRGLLQQRELFGEELSTQDITSIYISAMQKLSNIKFNKGQYDKTIEAANSRDALGEYALDNYGRVAVQNYETGEIDFKNFEELKDLEGNYSLLTNEDLLNLRAHSSNYAFNYKILELVNNNGIGMTKIADFLKSHMASLGTSKETIEGYTKQDSDNIKEGLELLKEAPAGAYKFTKYSGIQQKQAAMAIQYLSSILPRNMKNVMSVHAKLNGVSPSFIIQTLVGSTMSEESKLEFDAVTGKASKDSNGNSKDSDDGLKLDAATALISGKGYQGNIEFNPGTSYAVTVNARHSGFQKKSGENMGSGITMQEATTSTLDKVLDWNKATLGGSRINPTGYNRIMINNDDVVGVDLPVGSDKNTPDFTMLQKLQVLDQELLKLGIEDTPNNFKQVNRVCQQIGLPAKYKNDGSLNNYSWNRFAAFQVTADDSVLINKNIILEDILRIVEDDNVREQYEQIIQKDNKNYKLGNGFLGLGKQALYQGTVFVPIKSNYVASALSGGQDISMSQATDLELRERGYNQAKVATYKPAININEL